eukprot:2593560-Rhodomonas_salina.4
MRLGACCAMCGAEMSYAAARWDGLCIEANEQHIWGLRYRPTRPLCQVRYCPCVWYYAKSGTVLAYAVVRCEVLSKRMVLCEY